MVAAVMVTDDDADHPNPVINGLTIPHKLMMIIK